MWCGWREAGGVGGGGAGKDDEGRRRTEFWAAHVSASVTYVLRTCYTYVLRIIPCQSGSWSLSLYTLAIHHRYH